MIIRKLGNGQTVINLTPHEVIVGTPGYDQRFEPSGVVARVNEQFERVDGTTLCVDMCQVSVGDVVGLPDQAYNTWHIVSRMVYDACPNRTDLIVPANFRRDENGRITSAGCFITRINKRGAGMLDDHGDQRYPK